MSSLEARFQSEIMRHLDAAFNYARWLLRNEADAEDVVQEAVLEAYEAFGGFRGEHSRPWFLRIVRNESLNWMRKRNPRFNAEWPLDDEVPMHVESPQDIVIRLESTTLIRESIDSLPAPYREVLILRELEDMSYKEIATVTGLPIGTVMSRLSRARLRLMEILQDRREEVHHDL